MVQLIFTRFRHGHEAELFYSCKCRLSVTIQLQSNNAHLSSLLYLIKKILNLLANSIKLYLCDI